LQLILKQSSCSIHLQDGRKPNKDAGACPDYWPQAGKTQKTAGLL
jgi:hypothetical protein